MKEKKLFTFIDMEIMADLMLIDGAKPDAFQEGFVSIDITRDITVTVNTKENTMSIDGIDNHLPRKIYMLLQGICNTYTLEYVERS